MKLFALAGSLRQASLNRRLLGLAVAAARAAGVEVEVVEFRDVAMPLYDADLQAAEGLPPGAQRLIEVIQRTDGFLLASPEYNYSLPGTVKNTIDWVSRARPMPLRGKSAMLLSASTSLVGGNRGLWALRVPLESLGVQIHSDMFSLAQADKAFDAEGGLSDQTTRERLGKMVGGYLRMAGALAAG